LAATEELHRSMRASRGKQMLELVETLGGKPVSMKVCECRLVCVTAAFTQGAIHCCGPL
jgi:hypothetical protein